MRFLQESVIRLALAFCLFVSQAHAGSMTLLGVGKPAVGGATNNTSLDGSAQGTSVGSGNTCTVTLSTSLTTDIIAVMVVANWSTPGVPNITISDSAGLSYGSNAPSLNNGTARAFEKDGGNTQGQLLFTAKAASALTSDVITVTLNGDSFTYCVVAAIGVNGVNQTTIFDSNGVLPVQTGSSPSDPATFSTSNANDFIVAGFRVATANPTSGNIGGSAATQITGAQFQLLEYRKVTATQSSATATITTGSGGSNGAIVDAFVSN